MKINYKGEGRCVLIKGHGLKSVYKNVYIMLSKDWKGYLAKVGSKWRCIYDNEREAAIAVDKYLISKGKEPVNVLKRK